MSSFMAKSVNGDNSMVVIIDGVPYTADSTHPNYALLCKAYNQDDADSFVENYDINKAINNYVSSVPDNIRTFAGNVLVENGEIKYNGEVLRGHLIDRIGAMMSKGYDFKNMLIFLNNLHNNPSKHSLDQLHHFLENKSLPITPDGHFLAYKTVSPYNGPDFVDIEGRTVTKGDYVDKYTKTIRNNVGDVNSMPRNKVDDNPNAHCSNGYHVGALAYAGPGGWYNSSGDVVVIVKVDPRDAVSVPSDHSFQKLRTCRYEVVGTYQGELVKPVYDTEVDTYDDDSWQDYDSEEALMDDTDLFEETFIDIDDVAIGDWISCYYQKSDGTSGNRAVEVVEVHDNHFTVELLKYDYKYEKDGNNYRNFKFDRISDIQYLEL